MKVLSRYVAGEFIRNFFLALAGFSAIYLVVEFFERINAFLYNKAALSQMAAYFLYKTPSIAFQVAPASVLLSSIVTLGLMSRHNEILALKSGGVSLKTITLPILGVVALIYAGLLGFSEFAVSPGNQYVRQLRDTIIHKKKQVAAFKQSQIWIHPPQAIYNIRLYHPERNYLEGMTLYRLGPDFQLLERIDAASAVWEKGHWVFRDASVTRFPPAGFPLRKNYPFLSLALPETPEDFRIADKNPEEMNYRELKEYVSKIERDGYRSTRYRCAMHATFSYPFISVILAVLGIPLALRRERGAGIAMAIGACIVVSFAYFWVYSLILELGKAGTLAPWLSAWLGNAVFGLVGGYLFLSVRY